MPLYAVPVPDRAAAGPAPVAFLQDRVHLHAEITEVGGAVVLRDWAAPTAPTSMAAAWEPGACWPKDDLVQFANLPFRVRMQSTEDNPRTLRESACDQALALVLFDKLMAEHAVTPVLQPIVKLDGSLDHRLRGARPQPLVRTGIAAGDVRRRGAKLNLEVELSTMLRWEGVRGTQTMSRRRTCSSTRIRGNWPIPRLVRRWKLRQNWPDQPLTLEIHESASQPRGRLAELRSL